MLWLIIEKFIISGDGLNTNTKVLSIERIPDLGNIISEIDLQPQNKKS